MVMKRNAMRKNLRQSILKSIGRYIAIVAIIALGSSMFVGLLMTKTDMVATGQRYMDEKNMFDLRLVSSYGWAQDQLSAVANQEGVVDAEGIFYLDAVAQLSGSEKESVFRFYSLPDRVNQVTLRGGRMPEAANECLIDGYITTDDILGTTITISSNNKEETLETMVYDSYTVVGYVSTPLYMDMNRGTTSVGSGNLETYLFVPVEGLDADYFTEIHVTIRGDYEVYTDRYNDAMDRMANILEPELILLAEQRYDSVKSDATQAYRDGMLEYFEGVKEFHDEKAKAEKELADAWRDILDAEQQLQDARDEINAGWEQLRTAKNQLYAAQQELNAGREELENQKAPLYEAVNQAQLLMESGRGNLLRRIGEYEMQIQEIDGKLEELNEQLGPTDNRLAELNAAIAELDAQIALCDAGIGAAQAALELAKQYPELGAEVIPSLEAEIARLQAQKAGYEAQRTAMYGERDAIIEQMDDPHRERQELEEEKARLESEAGSLRNTLQILETALEELDNARTELDQQFAAAEQQLADGQKQINSGWAQIASNEKKLQDAESELEKGRRELETGKREYEQGKAEAEQEFADAERKLSDARLELDDALELIEDMQAPSLHILDRNSNIGYGSLDSSSDIVQGVSRVFPAFFLLVAALVCITTMTRMIDEERTQIGTLKALGYTNAEIISKYLIYAGSGAVIGCGLGVLVGSMIFPTILWQAYKIMLYITDDIVLRFNWWLCGAVVLAYTTVMLLVTWYCCKKALDEQPAELIRPKAPEAGKKLLLERAPFWHKISFLNKVTIRNIFRYRQRLAMMMVGIGGCTALLLTGFGLRDSIVNVVNYQFEEVTVYDLQVYFSHGISEADQREFALDLEESTAGIHFYHQQSMELDVDNMTRELYVMVSDSGIEQYVDFHMGSTKLAMPGLNEVMLTSGAADAMGIRVGDTVQLRNSDMETLNLTVSAIYDNHVHNYAVIRPETVQAQWGRIPELQMALIKAAEGQDIHELSAKITGMLNVMNVSVSEDLANMVGNMMKALDLVVWVIVFCAGLLAAIVLYNLTNININERLREIATIKVLGFNAGETAAYIFKENLSLTAVGSLIGLGLGYLLLQFVMSQIKIDMVWFKAVSMPVSYLMSILLTMVSACIVDFIFYFKLEKINMAEALKSVE